jgi:hypothetical protein
MSLEGGAFICYRHEFETGNVKTWDRHCFETKHTINTVQQCKKCGEWNSVEDMPIPERFVERSHSNKPEDQDVIVLKCPKCEGDNIHEEI